MGTWYSFEDSGHVVYWLLILGSMLGVALRMLSTWMSRGGWVVCYVDIK